MKGLFIPEITTEMFRNGCFESIEALMAEGEIYDIEYEPERKGEWIPCSERLPEKNGNYLIYVKSTQSKLWYMRVDHYNSDSHFWTETSERPHKRVLAWMPLPEPYMRGED